MRSLAQSRAGSLRTLLSGVPVRAVGRQDRRRRRRRRGAGVRRKSMKRVSAPLLLIGAGRMGGALLKGWIARKMGPVIVVEPKPSPELRALAKKKIITLVDAPSQVKAKKLSACVVALKPQILKGEAPVLADFARAGTLMISIAAGTHTKSLFKAWGAKARIIRAMPNTPGAIGHGISGLFAARGATEADKRKATALLSAL